MKTFQLRDGRQAYELAWTNSRMPRPWRNGYTRVMLPFTAREQLGARPGKTCHVQIVKTSNLTEI